MSATWDPRTVHSDLLHIKGLLPAWLRSMKDKNIALRSYLFLNLRHFAQYLECTTGPQHFTVTLPNISLEHIFLQHF